MDKKVSGILIFGGSQISLSLITTIITLTSLSLDRRDILTCIQLKIHLQRYTNFTLSPLKRLASSFWVSRRGMRAPILFALCISTSCLILSPYTENSEVTSPIISAQRWNTQSSWLPYTSTMSYEWDKEEGSHLFLLVCNFSLKVSGKAIRLLRYIS